MTAERRHPRRMQMSETGAHVPFVLAGLGFAIVGGFTLAIVLPLESALGIGQAGWAKHAQIHGHLQAVGFVALMIVGVTYHLLPAFEGRPIEHERLARPSLYLIGGGVLLRVLGQPLANYPLFGGMMVAGGLLELAGAVCFAVIVLATLRPSLFAGGPTPPFFAAGAVWFVVQAALGVWWLVEAALDGNPTLPVHRDGVLVTLQLLGFDLLFILGVGVRSFPVFFAAGRFGFRTVAVPHVLWQVALLLLVVAGLLGDWSSADAWGPTAAGSVLLGLGVLWVTMRTGWYRPPSRIRPASRQFAVPLQLALGWLTLASLLFVWLGVEGFLGRQMPLAYKVDAVRHIVAVGVVLTTIVAMAQLVLPEFASERFSGHQAAWRGVLLGGLLALATVLRSGTRWWVESLPGLWVNLSMALAGVIAMGVMVAFALLYLRGIRNHRALLARFAEMSERPNTWTITPVSRGQDGGSG